MEEAILTNVTKLGAEKLLFSWFDYTLFTFMMSVSALIGVYYGFVEKQENVVDYIFGGKSMKTFPIAVSLIATEVSGMEFIGVPADIYTYGMSFWFSVIPMIITGIITYYVFLPVFYKLQLASSFEYLKLRFDEKNSMLATFLMALVWVLCMPSAVYVPALAFSEVSDFDVNVVTFITAVVCVFYTTIGGLKAVVYTDALQFVMLVISIVIVLSFGVYETGGIKYIFQKSYEGGRIFIDFDPDPTNRVAFWGAGLTHTFSYLSLVAASQVCTQKFQALPTFNSVKNALIMFTIGQIIVKSTSTLTGLILYARYYDCDPVSTGVIDTVDQIIPYYVMDVVGKVPGLPGLFIAGIFCAALSTMSTDLNALSGIIYRDLVHPFMPANTTEKVASNMIKFVAVLIGVGTTGMVFIIPYLGSLFPLLGSIGNMTSGSILAMFSLGMCVPMANCKGTFVGALCGLFFMAWIILGSQYHVFNGGIQIPKLSTSTDGCEYAFNATVPETNGYYSPWIYRISFYHYSFMGFVVTMIVGIVVSYFTRDENHVVDKDLLSPVIYRFLSKELKKNDELNLQNVSNSDVK